MFFRFFYWFVCLFAAVVDFVVVDFVVIVIDFVAVDFAFVVFVVVDFVAFVAVVFNLRGDFWMRSLFKTTKETSTKSPFLLLLLLICLLHE